MLSSFSLQLLEMMHILDCLISEKRYFVWIFCFQSFHLAFFLVNRKDDYFIFHMEIYFLHRILCLSWAHYFQICCTIMKLDFPFCIFSISVLHFRILCCPFSGAPCMFCQNTCLSNLLRMCETQCLHACIIVISILPSHLIQTPNLSPSLFQMLRHCLRFIVLALLEVCCPSYTCSLVKTYFSLWKTEVSLYPQCSTTSTDVPTYN